MKEDWRGGVDIAKQAPVARGKPAPVTSLEIPPVKEARRLFKVAESEADRMRGVQTNFLFRGIGRKIYRLGFQDLARRLAPDEIATLRLKESRSIFEQAKIERERSTNFHDDPSPVPQRETTPRPIQRLVSDMPAKVQNTAGLHFHELVEDMAYEVHPEATLEEEEQIHWREWEVFNESDSKPQYEEHIEEQPFIFFDEEKKKVGLLKQAPNGYRVEPQTNMSLEQFINHQLNKLGYKNAKEDMKVIIKYIIENPVGNHAENLTDYTVRVGNKLYPIKRVNPGEISGIRYKNPSTNKLRVIFVHDAENIIFSAIGTHKKMMRDYSGRAW